MERYSAIRNGENGGISLGYTFVEKLFSNKVGRKVHAGEYLVVDVDVMMASDTTGPIAIQAFRDMGGTVDFARGYARRRLRCLRHSLTAEAY